MIRVFFGYTAGTPALFNVLQHSIHHRASQPVSITPLMLSQLGGVFTRPLDALRSTDFSFTRFLVPYLCGYQGWALFMDNDMLLQDDIAKLRALRDDRYAVTCVKHDHNSQETTKFLGQPQTKYQKKNRSSVMLFNCARCTALTSDYVNTASGLELHQFKWLGDDNLIGDLPAGWNHLVDVSPPNPQAKNIHYTLGGPYFNEYQRVEHAGAWLAERAAVLTCEQREG